MLVSPPWALKRCYATREEIFIPFHALSHLSSSTFIRPPPDRAGMTLEDGMDDLPAPSIANSIANSRFSRSTRERDLILELGPEGASAPQEALNEKAVKVIRYDYDPLPPRLLQDFSCSAVGGAIPF